MRKADVLGSFHGCDGTEQATSISYGVLLKGVNPGHKAKYKILVASETVAFFLCPLSEVLWEPKESDTAKHICFCEMCL